MRPQVARSMNSKAWRAAVVAAVSVGCLPAGVRAEPVRSGVYRAAEGPDVASWLEIRNGGRFRYVLSAGALDEQAEGRWQSDGDALLLYTEPKPVPPEFVLKHMASRTDAPFSLKVSWPDGGGIVLRGRNLQAPGDRPVRVPARVIAQVVRVGREADS